MAEPTVACIMLTRDRPEMARHAVECFRAQTYERKRLLVFNAGLGPLFEESDWLAEPCVIGGDAWTIGKLRNEAIRDPFGLSEIVVHWDDDDYSHPSRISEQVALLQASGADVVGYREALFWRECKQCHGFTDYCADVATCETCGGKAGEAWLYSSPSPAYAIGGSLCFWRSTWERKPFPDAPKRDAAGNWGTSEDVAWLRGLKTCAVSGIMMGESKSYDSLAPSPRFIGRIHGSNTMLYDIEAHPDSWLRVPPWDEHCRRIFA